MNMTKKNRQRLRTAYHEAGHAMAHCLLGFRIARVSIIPDHEEGNLGCVTGYKRSHKTREFIENYRPFPSGRVESGKIARWHDEVVCLLAGMEAVRLFMPGSRFRYGTAKFMPGSGSKRYVIGGDAHDVTDILSRFHPEDEMQLVYRWLAWRARNLVGHRFARPGIEALAKALIEKREMSGKEARSVIAEANRRAFDREVPHA